MNTVLRIIIYYFLLPISTLGYLSGGALADQPAEKLAESPLYDVQWTGQFTSSKDLGKENGIGRRMLDLLLGEKESRLVKPVALLAREPGRLWIADQGSQAIVVVDLEKRRMGSLGPGSRDQFPSLAGICFGEADEIFFSDSRRNRIFRQQGTEALRILNDTLSLQQPTGIAYDPSRKQIWVAETAAHHLAVLDRAGNRLRSVGRRGSAPGEFNFPTNLWIDRAGSVYVVDAMNFRVQILSPAGEALTVFGESGDASGYFARPRGIATDTLGHIYVVDGLFHTVQVFDRAGNFLTHFGKQGREAGEFWLPAGIYIDTANRIYVADTYNSRIQMFRLVQGAENED